MDSIIDELFYGNIRPDSRRYAPNSPFVQAAQIKNQNLDGLMAIMNEQEKDLFEKYCDAQGEIENITRYGTFTYALKFGILLMIEVFTGMDEVVGG